MYLSNAIIEITRRCNMTCAHCLRGNAQNRNISDEVLDKFFSKIEGIGDLTITGGEPSIAVDRIRAVLAAAKKHNVTIENFYIATNAKQVTNDFLLSIMELYCYCSDNEMSMVNYSNDDYHDTIKEDNIKKLSVLKFVSPKYEAGILQGLDYEINEGRAKENCIGNREETPKVKKHNDIEDFIFEETISSELELYLNCKGNLVAGCDWSYKSQDKKANKICTVDEFSLETVTEYIEKRIG